MEMNALFGQAVRDARDKAMIPRSELAKSIGISPSWLYKIEMLGKVPNGRLAMKMAESLDTTLRKLNNAAGRIAKKSQQEVQKAD